MKRRKKYKFAMFLGMLAAPVITLGVTACSNDNSHVVQNIKTFTTNDMHGRLQKEDSKSGIAGLGQIAGYLEVNNDYDLLLDAGDLLQGTVISNMDKGKTIYDIVNKMGYDAIAVGNHEFDFGLDNIEQIKNQNNKTKFLSNNIRFKETNEKMFESSLIKTIKGGLDVGIIGTTTETTCFTTNPNNVTNLNFTDIVEETRKDIEFLKSKGINFIVVLSHTGEEDATRLANELGDDIDLIVDGHSHVSYDKRVGDTYIIQTGEYTKHLRESNFNFNTKTGKIENFSTKLLGYDDLTNEKYKVPNDIQIQIDAQQKIVDEEFNQVVVDKLPYELDGLRSNIRFKETNLGDFAADAFYYEASNDTEFKTKYPNKNIDLAVVNSGGIRTSLKPGKITAKDVYDVYPFGNKLSVIEIKGSELLEALKYSVSKTGQGAMLQISDQLKLNIKKTQVEDTTNPGTMIDKFELIDAQIKKQDPKTVTDTFENIDENKNYVLATLDFLTFGGDGYSFFDYNKNENAKWLATMSDDRIVLENYLKFVYGKNDQNNLVESYRDVNGQNRFVVNPESQTKP